MTLDSIAILSEVDIKAPSRRMKANCQSGNEVVRVRHWNYVILLPISNVVMWTCPVTLPIHRPANFFEMRIGAQLSFRARYERSVQPSSQSVKAPVSKSITNWFANVSSSPDHFPDRWRLSSSRRDGVWSGTGVSSSGDDSDGLFRLGLLIPSQNNCGSDAKCFTYEDL